MSTPEIERLLDATRMADSGAYQIIQQVRDVVQAAAPECQERVMYGGIMFTSAGTDWGGVFAFKNHVSVEFSNGYSLEDVSGFLEGEGKFRRHIKLCNMDDVATKHLAAFIAQALDQL
jgi:hypothetical protein